MATIHRIGFSDVSSGSDQTKRIANVIFVHGLKGHPRKTWGPSKEVKAAPQKPRSLFRARSSLSSFSTASEGSAEERLFWPSDLLADDVPEARLWTYGYNADVLAGMFQPSSNSVTQHGRDLAARLERDLGNDDPIIFVAHSLGGIVVKDALNQSQSACKKTKLIVFLGTPHRGSAYAGWAEIVSNLARLIGQEANTKALRTLGVNSEVLDNIHEGFKVLVHHHDIKIHTFQESRSMPVAKGFNLKIVNDVSSKADLPRSIETVESLDADHMQMVKCGSKSDQTYRAISGVIKAGVRSIVETQTSSLSTKSEAVLQTALRPDSSKILPNGKFLVPYPINPEFVGRTKLLLHIREQLGHESRPNVTPRRRVALHGLGGIGKTQIALSYVYRLRETHPETSIFWVHAGSANRFRHAYSRIAVECEMADVSTSSLTLDLVKKRLEEPEFGPWLLVIDNADDAELFFASSEAGSVRDDSGSDKMSLLSCYIPDCDHGNVLITTRNKAVGVKLAPGRAPIEVDKMSDDEADELIRAITMDGSITAEESAALAAALECLPLCLAQAGAFILENSISVTDYLKLLEEGDNVLTEQLSEPFEAVGRDSDTPHAVTATWILSFELIRSQCELASDILSLLCLFDRQAIPKVFLSEYYEDTRGKVGASEKVTIMKALGMLKAFSFITEASGDQLSMHRLVQLVTRKWLIQAQSLTKFASAAVGVLAEFYPNANDETQHLCTGYLPHINSVLKFETDDSEYVHVWRALLLYNVASYWIYMDDFAAAEEAAMKSLRLSEKVHGPEHNDTLRSLEIMSIVYSGLDRDDEAEKIDLQVVDIRLRCYGEDDPKTLESLSILGETYRMQGRVKEAEELFVKILDTAKRALGENDRETLDHMKPLANVYEDQERWDEAASLLVSLIDKRKRVLGPTNFQTLESMSSLVYIYKKQKLDNLALPVAKEAYEGSKSNLGPDHNETLNRMKALCYLYVRLGLLEEAENLKREQIRILRNKLDPDHFELADALGSLGHIISDQGKYEEAAHYHEIQFAWRKKHLGETDVKTLTSMDIMAYGLNNQNKPREAIALGQESVDLWRSIGRYADRGRHMHSSVTFWKALLASDNGQEHEFERLMSEATAMDESEEGQDEPRDDDADSAIAV